MSGATLGWVVRALVTAAGLLAIVACTELARTGYPVLALVVMLLAVAGVAMGWAVPRLGSSAPAGRARDTTGAGRGKPAAVTDGTGVES